MVKIKDLLISTLQPLGYPIILEGTLTPDEEYPESFFTFWNNETPGISPYDNESRYYVWDFDLSFYSTDPALVNSKLIQAKTLLKAQGFIVPGKGYDVPSDEITHTGRRINALKLEIEEE